MICNGVAMQTSPRDSLLAMLKTLFQTSLRNLGAFGLVL